MDSRYKPRFSALSFPNVESQELNRFIGEIQTNSFVADQVTRRDSAVSQGSIDLCRGQNGSG
jgi:hypothetical protein